MHEKNELLRRSVKLKHKLQRKSELRKRLERELIAMKRHELRIKHESQKRNVLNKRQPKKHVAMKRPDLRKKLMRRPNR